MKKILSRRFFLILIIVIPIIFLIANYKPAATHTPETSTRKPTPIPTKQLKLIVIQQDPNFGVKYDRNTEKCSIVDRNTGNPLNTFNSSIANLMPFQQTGIGATKEISTTLQPGQTAIIQGWKVDSQDNGVFMAVIAINKTKKFANRISNGQVDIVSNQDGPQAFCNAVQTAVNKKWAHSNIQIPEQWR